MEGDTHTLAVTTGSNSDSDMYHQILLPRFSEILKNISPEVLDDFTAEIDEVKITIMIRLLLAIMKFLLFMSWVMRLIM